MNQPCRILTNRVIAAVGAMLWLGCPLTPGLLAGSTVDEQIKTIRSRYEAVDKGLSRCKKVRRDLPGKSAEGGELTAYLSDQSIRKMTAKFYGETGYALEEYYFWDGRLFFVLRVESRYDKPLSGKVVSKSEERFYFADDALIRWLDPQKKEIPAGRGFQQRGGDWLAQAKKYMILVNN